MEKKKHRVGEIEAMYFDKMPQRCKELFFEYMFNTDIDINAKEMFFRVGNFSYEYVESPIEHIFNFAFDLLEFAREGATQYIYLLSQEEITVNGKTYRADFLFDSNECESPYSHFPKPFKLVIECDGHDYHERTKAQVKKANERDLALKMAGYDVLHLSGSQIYNEPFECARKVMDYILLNVGGENEQGMDSPAQKN